MGVRAVASQRARLQRFVAFGLFPREQDLQLDCRQTISNAAPHFAQSFRVGPDRGENEFMIGFGAIVKSIARALETASSAVALVLQQASGGRRPKLCPIPIPVEARRPRR